MNIFNKLLRLYTSASDTAYQNDWLVLQPVYHETIGELVCYKTAHGYVTTTPYIQSEVIEPIKPLPQQRMLTNKEVATYKTIMGQINALASPETGLVMQDIIDNLQLIANGQWSPGEGHKCECKHCGEAK